MHRYWFFVLVVIVTKLEGSRSWDAVTYYTNRYSADGISYNSSDAINGLYSSGGYQLSSGSRNIVGCSYNETRKEVISCSGPTVYLAGYGFGYIARGTLQESITSLTIRGCSSFTYFEERTFENLTNLETIIVQRTALNHVPDLSNTKVKLLNMAGNSIQMDTHNHRGWTMPSTIERIALMQNNIHWIPKGMISGPNLRLASFGYNKLKQIQPSIFGDVSSLIYFGVEGNEISRLTMNSIAPLATNNFMHLNLSNNALEYIQPRTFNQLPALRILEVQGNSLTTITWDIFTNMPHLVHLDLHGNEISALPTKSFENLPSLKQLRVHTQRPAMTNIAYDAWKNIGDNLLELLISDNNLRTFPHPLMEEGYYPKLHTIYADHNKIQNITEYDVEAFPSNQLFLHRSKSNVVVPFSAYPNLKTLYLHNNLITFVNNTDLCPLKQLEKLYMYSNQIRDDTLDPDAFGCLPSMWFLHLSSNLIQYVPDSLKTSAVVPALRYLYLSNNRLTFLEEDAFSGVDTLTYLYLDDNFIIAIENGAFPSQIEYINLSGNKYRFVYKYSFRYLSNLVTLVLTNNRIQILPDLAFENCTSLRNLYLNSNSIPQLRIVHFQNCPLNSVSFSNNEIGWVEDGIFSHLSSMSSLDLSSNRLTKIPMGGTFHDIYISGLSFYNNRINLLPTGTFKNARINSLSLQNNYVTEVLSYAFDDVTAGGISLNNNEIRKIYSYAFNTVRTSYLHLGGNPIRELSSYSFNSVSITGYRSSLSLAGMWFTHVPEKALHDFSAYAIYMQNGKIETFSPHAFHDVSVTIMNLENNPFTSLIGPLFGGISSVSWIFFLRNSDIREISYDAFDNVTLSNIRLENNLLSIFPQALKTQTPPFIDLSNNKISQIPSGSFDGQTTLDTLNISNNELKSLENGLLDELISMETLVLSHNQLSTLPRGLLDNLTKLRILDLSNNVMTHIHFLGNKSQLNIVDLTENNIETMEDAAFSGLPTLRFLYLAGNPLECSCQLVHTLTEVTNSIQSGDCNEPPQAYNITFSILQSSPKVYFKNVDESIIPCSVDSLGVFNITPSSFTIRLEQPSSFNLDGITDDYQGELNYTIECISASSDTLSSVLVDYNITDGPTSFVVNFNSSDGVTSGTSYECAISLSSNVSQTAKSNPVVFTTPGASEEPTVYDEEDVELQIKYYDFSKSHTDFNDIGYISISDPNYVDSPYGAWLSASVTPIYDTFSTWFRFDWTGRQNFEVEGTLVLRHLHGTTKRFWAESYFPIDGIGFQEESQQDCGGTYHNFGFTSTIRTGFVFNGSEVFTIAGGEALWLYINKIRVVEFVSNGSAEIPCYKVELSETLTKDGVVYPQVGVLENGTCITTVTMSRGVHLELEAGVTYHFDLFHAETRTCTSELLLQVEGTLFSPNKSLDLPLDYTVLAAEDVEIGAILSSVTISDVFSDDAFSVNVYSGNEEERFTVTSSNYEFIAPSPAPIIYTNITDVNGNPISFVECTPNPPASIPYTERNFTYSINTSSVYLTLNNQLDFERNISYYLLIEVVDVTKPLTGYVSIRVIVSDVNDNCPMLSPSNLTITPRPVLAANALTKFIVTDADSGENGNVFFAVSRIFEQPPIDYGPSLDIWTDVYSFYTTLEFKVIAIDNGTIPRGVTSSIQITLSNTCVVDMLFGIVEQQFYVDNATAELFLRIPKYWVYNFPCSEDVGLTKGSVLDSMLSASSSYHNIFTGPGRARVNNSENTFSGLSGGWVAGTVDVHQYMQVDMGVPYRFTRAYIQGRADADEWVTAYQIHYFDVTNGTWIIYRDVIGTQIFNGTSDRNTVSSQELDPVILAQKIRVNPVSWHGSNISMRLEFAGCSQEEQLYYDVTCVRCETSYYCEGDGQQRPCGRCLGHTNSTCSRSPVEHSYGLAAVCSPCPEGWICKNGYARPCEQYHYAQCTNTTCPDDCTHCEAGTACYEGKRSVCPPGTFSNGMMEHCESCKAGYYQDAPGQSTCLPCPAGFHSGPRMDKCTHCAPEEYSTGTQCVACTDASHCPCLTRTVCYDSSLCYNIGDGGAACDPCPPGLEGDGATCIDVDECALYRPCFQDRCINTAPGYQCLECPDGYTGSYEDAYAWDIHLRVFVYTNIARSNFTYQTCDDVDECEQDHGGCDALMPCVNTNGSHYCDFCETGYIGTNKSGCYLDNFCVSGSHDCMTEADCIYLGPAQFRCVCKPGFAGNGEYCGRDSDNDGFPDLGLQCSDWGCTRDNCGSISNSMQEDTDRDNKGDNCDADDDNDGRYDYLDNCQFVANWDQADTDGDGAGDACDNCPYDVNLDQMDTDVDGQGDVCDDDDDNDGIPDITDNCPLVANPGQENSDGDSHGDACDNCPNTQNEAQTDTNENLAGDECDPVQGTNIDGDGDSILDIFDNCPTYMNGDQSDTDGDGDGDLCDTDIDNDGHVNSMDNCPYFSNTDQADADGNGVGDVCETDFDGDGVADKNDTCPHNPNIHFTSFKSYFTVDLYPSLNASTPIWRVKNNGGEIMQTTITAKPIMLLGTQSYSAVEYKGTWFASGTKTSADYLGFVFGYVSNRKFYIVTWKQEHNNYQTLTYEAGIQGIHLKLVDSNYGPGPILTHALWDSYDETGQVTTLWHDPDVGGWEPDTAYRWYLTHQPSTGYINLQIYRGDSLLSNSGDLHDMTITGGRLGVFQFGEMTMIWSNLVANCLDHSNHGLHFDGADDYVQLDDLAVLQMDNSFTLETWVSLDNGYTMGPYPLFCSVDDSVCLYINASKVVGRYGNSSVTSATSLSANIWYNVIFRHSIETESLSIFINGVIDNSVHDVEKINVTELANLTDTTAFLGKHEDTFFRGTIDEFRLYSEAIQDNEIIDHISLPALDLQILQAYGTLHLRMEDSVGADILHSSGLLSAPSAIRNGGTFVTSYQQYEQFKIFKPNN